MKRRMGYVEGQLSRTITGGLKLLRVKTAVKLPRATATEKDGKPTPDFGGYKSRNEEVL
jgi:hypothetical protein